MSSIIGLPQEVSKLSKEEKLLFKRIYSLCETTGKITIPDELKPWADKTFGDHKLLLNQKILKIANKFTYEEAIFNELRSKRPMDIKPSDEALKEIGTSCEQFCNPEKNTPYDENGRIKGKSCITAANITNFETHHGIIIFNKHNPFDSNEDDIVDYLQTAKKWLELTNKKNKSATYPFIMWNFLWRAGASINHGHIQVLLGEGFHHGDAQTYNACIKNYKKKFKRDFFQDIFKIHNSLGLGLEYGTAKAFTCITPRKDKEVTIISKQLDENCMRLTAKVAVCLTKELGVESFDMGIILPPLTKNKDWKDFPVIVKFIDRGKLGRKGSEIAASEYISRRPVVEVDPYIVISKLKEKIKFKK